MKRIYWLFDVERCYDLIDEKMSENALYHVIIANAVLNQHLMYLSSCFANEKRRSEAGDQGLRVIEVDRYCQLTWNCTGHMAKEFPIFRLERVLHVDQSYLISADPLSSLPS